jgi:acetyl esterase/lipase
MYQSRALNLKAYLQIPDRPDNSAYPAVVFFHGGCALDHIHFVRTSHFVDAGYVVLSPTFRGENGNPGNYELFFGEVHDARAAIKWLVQQPYVDAQQVYTFGTSMGGEISALLSLYGDPAIQLTGSCGAFFARTDPFSPESMFNAPVPFDRTNKHEKAMRTLAGNIHDMQVGHYAFIGTEDDKFEPEYYRNIETNDTLLTILEVPGDHGESVHYAAKEFLKIINR